MSSPRSFIATIAACAALATGASFAQTMPATPNAPHPVQNAVPPTTTLPAQTTPARPTTLPAASTTAGVPLRQQELQRQQQNLRSGVKSTTDQGMHPRAGQTQNGIGLPANPASARSSH